MRLKVKDLTRTIRNKIWWVLLIIVSTSFMDVTSLSGPNVCMVQQKYNITKRVKYRAPMAVRTYVWCFNMPPRCSKWSTEMRDLTRLETEERTAEMAVCCPGYKIKDISCVPICPHGKTGHGCSEDCPPNKWGHNCVNDCKSCHHGSCSPATGKCQCHPGWQGESCQTSLSTTPQPSVQLLITPSSASTKTISVVTTPATSTSTIETSTATSIITSTTLVPTTTTKIVTVAPTATTRITAKSTATTLTKEADFTTAMTKLTSAVVMITNVAGPYRNETISSLLTTFRPETEVTKNDTPIKAIYSKTNSHSKKTSDTQAKTTSVILFSSENTSETRSIANVNSTTTTIKPESSTAVITATENLPQITHKETAKSTKTTAKPSTLKFQPKEIWIKPAQKGESIMVETKLKSNYELSKLEVDNKKDFSIENTTPKTIIVSIIPTSVTYVTYKKLALTTSSFTSQKNNTLLRPSSKYTREYTKPITMQTSTSKPFTVKILNAIASKANLTSSGNIFLQNVTQHKSPTTFATKKNFETSLSSNQMTNSMSSTLNVNSTRLDSSNPLTTPLSSIRSTERIISFEKSTHKSTTINVSLTTEHSTKNKHFVTVKENATVKPVREIFQVTSTIRKEVDTNVSKTVTRVSTKTESVTENPMEDEETFHILTEPEHITAVMGENGNKRSSIDLISVISIAGGVMIAIITVAVVIVMLERCKKPTYDEVRKYNDISMQVMIDNNDIPPPPYVRSIFHTPLPEPPIEKCHYQPISTLDRNLKQFMRPVVVQTISPLMLENFRGILECHYDHLPRRSHDFETMHSQCSLAPPSEECVELLHTRVVQSLTDSAIEALKCEAKLDVIDDTTSEPLYAEIPCWRPPSEHAVEVVKLNGEAVTEL